MKKIINRVLSITLVILLMISVVPLTVSAAIRIGKVEVTDLDAPTEGDFGDYTVTLGSTAYELEDRNDAQYVNGIKWADENGKALVPGIDKFEAGVSYTVEIILVPKKSNLFQVVNATINGEVVTCKGTVTQVTLTKTFPATDDSPHIHKVTFDYGFDGIVDYDFCNNGEVPPIPEYCENGELVMYDWYSDKEFTNTFNFNEPLYEDVYLYARYVDPADIVSVYMYTTDNDFPYSIEDAVIGDCISVEDPYVEGWFFTEWYSDPDRVWCYDMSQPITGDVHLYARMIPYDDVATVYTYMPDEYFYTNVYEIEKGRTINFPDPELDEMYFAGWYRDRELTKPFYKSQPVTEDIALFAKFVPISEMNTVSVYIEDDTVPAYTTLIEDGYCYLITSQPSVEGKVFFGWFTDPERLTPYDSLQPITEDVSIYAKFVAEEDLCYVSVYIDGDTPISKGYVERGTTYSRPDPSKEGHTFFGWYCEPERINEFDFSQPITEDVSIYAKFVADEDICYVNIYLDGDMPIASGMVEKGTTYSIEDPDKEDMTFFGWYCEPERINKFDFSQPITEDVSIYAKFVADEDICYVNIYLDGDMPIASGMVEKGTTYSIEDPGKEDMIFDGWYCEPERINKFDFSQPITEDISIYAKFVPKPLLGDANEDGVVNITDATAIQKHIAKITALSETGAVLADVDSDGNVNITDATLVQKYLAGLDTEYPIGKTI